jgi:2-polyprenyl-3-methyl-5-hydroxy-6-metoxy-1,4-benzoquinol methylase
MAPGVDMIADITEFHEHHMFDVVISCEMLEHCKDWDIALANMYLCTKPGGLLIITCAGPGRHEHGTYAHTPEDSKFTLDHYRNISIEDFLSVLPMDYFHDCSLELTRDGQDLYFYGIVD